MKPSRILFVCLGNICRSPAAEGVMRSLVQKAGLGQAVHVASAGTIGMHAGSLPDPRMRTAARKRGYVLESRARQLEASDFARFDLILAMDAQNLRDIRSLASSEEERGKARLFCEFCTRHPETQVPDPYYGGPEGFEKVLDLLEDGCEALLKGLREG